MISPQGDWCITRKEVNALVDTRSLVMDLVLERHGAILEETKWLHPTNNAQHINLVQLDTALKGLILALQWQSKVGAPIYSLSMCLPP